MFDCRIESVDSNTLQYRLSSQRTPLTWSGVLELWQHDKAFRSYFSTLLADAPFAAFRWETPPLTRDTLSRPFEFVLLDAPHLLVSPDLTPFAEFFSRNDADDVVVRTNLGGDALMVVPAPLSAHENYTHIAAFLRQAPGHQQQALWRVTGKTMQRQLSDNPLWLTTAGGGVDWLHVRLDSRPKYYQYGAYRKFRDSPDKDGVT